MLALPQTAILSIDQGTTSSRAIIFARSGEIIASAQLEFTQQFPRDGWVEHDPEEIWRTSLKVSQTALREAEAKGYRTEAIGITNQRETTILWDRNTGKPVCNAIVWQDRRTADYCKELRASGYEDTIKGKTGLLLDPYFSASKIAWILDNVPNARTAAEDGQLAFGTIDSFLIWRLTGGKVHATDTTNASRTSLFNIHTLDWDQDLLELFGVPRSLLPDARDSSDDYGSTAESLFGRCIPICGVAGDQQAAAFGQACFKKGDVKSTYGTGCFALLNTGHDCVNSDNRLLSTIAYTLNGKATYALEGSIFNAGATMQWLRDELNVIDNARQSERMAEETPADHGVFLVPAFTGLGAPYWVPDARAAIFGMTRATARNEFVRAALESVCYQTHDLFDAMANDGHRPSALKVDGGMVANKWLLQFLADILGMKVERPANLETTALGAAYLAGLKAGIYDSLDEIAGLWKIDCALHPGTPFTRKQGLLDKWHKAVSCTRSFSK